MFDIEKSKAICEAATEGPWYKVGEEYPNNESGRWVGLIANRASDAKVLPRDGFERESDLDFVAHARTALPLALTEIEAKDREIERLQKLVVDAFDEGFLYGMGKFTNEQSWEQSDTNNALGGKE